MGPLALRKLGFWLLVLLVICYCIIGLLCAIFRHCAWYVLNMNNFLLYKGTDDLVFGHVLEDPHNSVRRQ